MMRNATISVDTPPPADPFDAVLKTPRELLLFDAQASAFRPVKVRGQIVYADSAQLFLEESGTGLRLLPVERTTLKAGDLVEAVNREQYRIGNDLHDGLGQELTGVALMMRGVAGRLASEYPPILPEIEGITRLVNNAIESTRALARGLSPVNLERGGLQGALEGLAMHAAEGALYRDCVAEACESLGFTAVVLAADELDPHDALIGEFGAVAGRPWRREHKDAARAALAVVSSRRDCTEC